MKIKDLEEYGLKVFVSHRRPTKGFGLLTRYELEEIGKDASAWEPKGGRTHARLVDKNTKKVVASGLAVCSNKDHYSRKMGRNIAVGRAVHEYFNRKQLEVGS